MGVVKGKHRMYYVEKFHAIYRKTQANYGNTHANYLQQNTKMLLIKYKTVCAVFSHQGR